MADSPVDVTQTAHDSGEASPGPRDWSAWIVASPDESLVGRILPIGEDLCVGRTSGPGVDIAIADRLLSRQHASLRQRGTFVELVDHDSKNGSFLDGRRCATGILREDSVVRLGGTLLVLSPLDPGPDADSQLVGRSAPLRELVASLDRIADQPIDVLVLGETGTGKELAAQHLHRRSDRRGALVPVNCGAIPEKLIESYLFGHRKGAFTGATEDQPGVFERANAGTLFLDEIGELPLELQPRLLRVLESREYVPVGATEPRRCDVRVVSATNVELDAACKRGAFRADLYARLAGYVVQLPPLRARRGDIPELVRHFLGALAPTRRVDVDGLFLERLMLHDWPLNVRGLRAVTQRVLVDSPGERLRVDDLPDSFRRSSEAARTATAPGGPPDAAELEQALRELDGSVAALAAHYEKDRKQIYRWLKKYDLDPERFRA